MLALLLQPENRSKLHPVELEIVEHLAERAEIPQSWCRGCSVVLERIVAKYEK